MGDDRCYVFRYKRKFTAVNRSGLKDIPEAHRRVEYFIAYPESEEIFARQIDIGVKERDSTLEEIRTYCRSLGLRVSGIQYFLED